jgi:hypothetical protein
MVFMMNLPSDSIGQLLVLIALIVCIIAYGKWQMLKPYQKVSFRANPYKKAVAVISANRFSNFLAP